MTDIPDWAGKRACELLNIECGYTRYTWPEARPDLGVRTVAKLVMQHEQPPIDPDVEAVKRIIRAWYGFSDNIRTNPYYEPGSYERAVAQYKQERSNG